MDSDVCDAIREQLTHDELQQGFDLDVMDSEPPTGDQLAERIESDIDQADVVACIFTRRHLIEGEEDGYTAPPYVVAEAGYARARGKKLIVFLEEGVDRAQMGLIDAANPQYLTFSRDDLDTAQFGRRVRTLARAQLREHEIQVNPAHVFSSYNVHYTIYPNGYQLAHYKIAVEAIRNEPIGHHFYVMPSGGAEIELPSTETLLAVGRQHPCPYPSQPFVAFRSDSDAIDFGPAREEEPRQRWLRVELPRAGKKYRYQWMTGMPAAFNPDRELESSRLGLSDRAVRRVDMMVRLRHEIDRPNEPRLTEIGSGTTFEQRNDETLRPYYERARSSPEDTAEVTPLYRCYKFTVAPIPAATDLLLMF